MGKVRIVKIQSIRTPSYLSLILTLLSTEKAGGSFKGWLNFKFNKDHSEHCITLPKPSTYQKTMYLFICLIIFVN